MTARRLTVIATGPSGPPEELDALRRAGHAVVIGRPLDTASRRAYTEGELVEQCRVADVVLASHLERITPAVMQHAEHLGLVIVPFIGVTRSMCRPPPAWACWWPTVRPGRTSSPSPRRPSA